MPTSYFELNPAAQTELLNEAFTATGISPMVVEKDIWLTLVLQTLFSMPNRKAMAFKGGTSLSKVYGIIKRFSEDVDITVDFRELGCDQSLPDLLRLTKGQRRRVSDTLIQEVSVYVRNFVLPFLKRQLADIDCAKDCEISLSEDGESIQVRYPTRAGTGEYLRDHVLIEFGGRNIIDPNASHSIRPDIADHFQSVLFPHAEQVVVLSPARTFWEKVTLIHAQCNKPIAEGKDRISRHWYDLAMLLQHPEGAAAKQDIALLRDVVQLKSVFYNSGTAHYDRCLNGNLNLIPSDQNFSRLEDDYYAMLNSGMMNGHFYPLGQIMQDLSDLQDQVNQMILADHEPQTDLSVLSS